jgi:beta-glucosidase-like glycosyl hydrolase
VITDSLVMKAIHDRYGHHRAAVLTLQAGADMAMALGTRPSRRAAVQAIADAQASGALTLPRCCGRTRASMRSRGASRPRARLRRRSATPTTR